MPLVSIMALVVPSVVIESWLLLAYLCMGIKFPAGRLWASTSTIACELLWWCWLQEAKFASAGFHACQGFLLLNMLLVKLIRSCSDVDWIRPLSVLFLVLLQGALVQANVRNCLWLALSNLFGASSNPICGSLCWASVSMGRTTLCTEPGFYWDWAWEQVSKSPTSACLCLLSAC